MRHKQETNSDHFARWPQQSSTWPRCCRPNRPPRLAPVSTVCLPRVDTCIHILPSYLAATHVTLEIQTRHASDVFKVDSVADVTLLHVQFSYQDILNVLSTNLTPLSHLIIKIKILFGMVHLYSMKGPLLQCYMVSMSDPEDSYIWIRPICYLPQIPQDTGPDTARDHEGWLLSPRSATPTSDYQVELQTIHRFLQSCRRSLLGPSPGWKRLF